MRHTISVLVENEFGVLSRVAGLFSGRGFNIESLCVAESLDPTVSTMTIVTSGNDAIIEQVLKQLNKLINVIKVVDFKDLASMFKGSSRCSSILYKITVLTSGNSTSDAPSIIRLTSIG